MGIPGIQLFLIFARQMAKPVSNGIMTYGKKHPFIRNRIIIPTGRGIANFTTRLRMRDLGLGKPANLVQISDEAALEQASDILQEIVLYIYGIGIFSFYYYYTKTHEKDLVSTEELKEFEEKLEIKLVKMQQEIQELRKHQGEPKNKSSSSSSWFGKSKSVDQESQTTTTCSEPTITRTEAMQRLSRKPARIEIDTD